MGARSSSQAAALDCRRHVRRLDPVVRRRLYRPLRSMIQLTLLLVLFDFGAQIDRKPKRRARLSMVRSPTRKARPCLLSP